MLVSWLARPYLTNPIMRRLPSPGARLDAEHPRSASASGLSASTACLRPLQALVFGCSSKVVGDFAEAVKKEHHPLLADVNHAQIVLSACRKQKDGSGDQLEELRRGMSLEELRTNPDFESNSDDTPIVVNVLPPPKGETKMFFLEEKRKGRTATSIFDVTEATFKTLMLQYGSFKCQSDNQVVLEFEKITDGATYVASFDHSVSQHIFDNVIIEFDGAFRLPHWIALVEAKHQVRKEHIDEFPSRIEKFRRLQQDPSVRMDDRLRDTHCDIQGYIGGQFFPLQLRNYAKSLGLIAVTKNGGAFGIEDYSQAAIDAIKKSTNLVSERNLLKLSCHGMLSAIHEITTMQHINIDLVKVKGHSGIPMNELADSLAKDARALPASHHDPLLQVNDDYLLDLCHMETLLHQDSIPIEIYPSKLLKSVPYAQWSTATNATLAKHNPGIPTANWDLTLRLINIGCGKIDHLDSSHTNETAFRLRLLTGRLQTNARIHGFGTLPDAKCPRCPCPSETRDHFLACPANVALLPRIVARTRELLVSRMSSARHWSPLTSIRNVPAGLLKALMLTRPNCLSSPTAKGIITSQLVNRVSRKLKAKLPLQTRRLAAIRTPPTMPRSTKPKPPKIIYKENIYWGAAAKRAMSDKPQKYIIRHASLRPPTPPATIERNHLLDVRRICAQLVYGFVIISNINRDIRESSDANKIATLREGIARTHVWMDGLEKKRLEHIATAQRRLGPEHPLSCSFDPERGEPLAVSIEHLQTGLHSATSNKPGTLEITAYEIYRPHPDDFVGISSHPVFGKHLAIWEQHIAASRLRQAAALERTADYGSNTAAGPSAIVEPPPAAAASHVASAWPAIASSLSSSAVETSVPAVPAGRSILHGADDLSTVAQPPLAPREQHVDAELHIPSDLQDRPGLDGEIGAADVGDGNVCGDACGGGCSGSCGGDGGDGSDGGDDSSNGDDHNDDRNNDRDDDRDNDRDDDRDDDRNDDRDDGRDDINDDDDWVDVSDADSVQSHSPGSMVSDNPDAIAEEHHAFDHPSPTPLTDQGTGHPRRTGRPTRKRTKQDFYQRQALRHSAQRRFDEKMPLITQLILGMQSDLDFLPGRSTCSEVDCERPSDGVCFTCGINRPLCYKCANRIHSKSARNHRVFQMNTMTGLRDCSNRLMRPFDREGRVFKPGEELADLLDRLCIEALEEPVAPTECFVFPYVPECGACDLIKGTLVTLVDMEATRTVRVRHCHEHDPLDSVLVKNRYFPGRIYRPQDLSNSSPKAFSIEMLEYCRIFQLEGRISLESFLKSVLAFQKDLDLSNYDSLKRDFAHASEQYRVFRNRHERLIDRSTDPDPCPACPKNGDQGPRHVAVDGNFHLCRRANRHPGYIDTRTKIQSFGVDTDETDRRVAAEDEARQRPNNMQNAPGNPASASGNELYDPTQVGGLITLRTVTAPIQAQAQTQTQTQAQAQAQAQASGDAACGSNFRALSKGNVLKGNFSDKGIIGAVCARHGHAYGFVNLKHGERFVCLRYLLDEKVFKQQSNNKIFIYYDVGCKLKSHYENLNLLDGRDITFVVPKFHALAHGTECRRIFSPEYHEGTGITDGEACKRFWADISWLAGIIVNMSPINRLNMLEEAILWNNQSKAKGMLSSLSGKAKALIGRLEASMQVLVDLNRQLKRRVRSGGFQDYKKDPAAIKLYKIAEYRLSDNTRLRGLSSQRHEDGDGRTSIDVITKMLMSMRDIVLQRKALQLAKTRNRQGRAAGHTSMDRIYALGLKRLKSELISIVKRYNRAIKELADAGEIYVFNLETWLALIERDGHVQTFALEAVRHVAAAAAQPGAEIGNPPPAAGQSVDHIVAQVAASGEEDDDDDPRPDGQPAGTVAQAAGSDDDQVAPRRVLPCFLELREEDIRSLNSPLWQRNILVDLCGAVQGEEGPAEQRWRVPIERLVIDSVVDAQRCLEEVDLLVGDLARLCRNIDADIYACINQAYAVHINRPNATFLIRRYMAKAAGLFVWRAQADNPELLANFNNLKAARDRHQPKLDIGVDALSKAEKRALWRDIFDADWRPGTQWQSLKPNETLSVCTNKDLRHIRTIDMFKLIRDNIKCKAGLMQLAMRRGWFDCVSYSDATPANLRDADLDLEQFRSVIERFKVRVNLELIAAAAETGRIDVIQWLRTVATKGIWRKQIMDAAARSGHLELVKWLHENIKVGCSEAAMNGAAGNGHLNVVEWLQNNRREGCTDAELDQAAANGHLAAVEWLHNNRREGCTRLAMDNAAGNGHLAVVEFLHNNRTEGCTVLAMTSAAENGHVAVVEFLHLNRTEGCDPDVINKAARNGHLPVVEFLHRHRAMTCSQFTLDMLMLNDQLNVARFLIAECGLMPSDDTLLSSVRFSNTGRLRLVVELGLHHRLPIERIVSDVNEEALKTIAEHSTDAQRAEMMRIVTRKGNMKAMNVLQKHWPSVVDSITMADLSREYSYRADNDPNKVRFLELSMLDFVFKHRRDMLDDAWAAENLSLAVTHARHGHTAWIRSRFPAVFAAHPASKIDGEAADAIIDTLAKSGERSAMGSLEFAIKRGDVAAVKWLLANIHTADGKFEKRGAVFLRRL
ncbi:hypothetical protein HK105_208634 [Polyrhizophydium stewartii]|uniref:RNase H type-1 domain-containing protein n=1 Tax=Polyrhizophydium stewartii TaxID=2732419 RepID=A0ABR4MXG9_9FUNG